MTTQTLLIELLTEELPPKALNNLGNHFAASVAEGLEKAQLIDGAAEYTAYASPRRLAVQVKNVKAVQADQKIVKKGPAVANAMKDGVPTKALEGFARGAGASKTCTPTNTYKPANRWASFWKTSSMPL